MSYYLVPKHNCIIRWTVHNLTSLKKESILFVLILSPGIQNLRQRGDWRRNKIISWYSIVYDWVSILTDLLRDLSANPDTSVVVD